MGAHRAPFFSEIFLNPFSEGLVRIICADYSFRLHYGQSRIPVLEIIPDPAGLYRIAWPDIGLSDLAKRGPLREQFERPRWTKLKEAGCAGPLKQQLSRFHQ